jgi:hypothetical protein
MCFTPASDPFTSAPGRPSFRVRAQRLATIAAPPRTSAAITVPAPTPAANATPELSRRALDASRRRRQCRSSSSQLARHSQTTADTDEVASMIHSAVRATITVPHYVAPTGRRSPSACEQSRRCRAHGERRATLRAGAHARAGGTRHSARNAWPTGKRKRPTANAPKAPEATESAAAEKAAFDRCSSRSSASRRPRPSPSRCASVSASPPPRDDPGGDAPPLPGGRAGGRQ